MKLNGERVEGPNVSMIVLPRSTGDLVFKAQAVLDYDDFLKLCPEPNTPEILLPGGEIKLDINNKAYRERLVAWAQKKTSWMFLKSLEATENLEWETVDYDNPETWDNYKQEMQESGFSPVEITRVLSCVMEANSLDQDEIDDAMKRFLAGREKE